MRTRAAELTDEIGIAVAVQVRSGEPVSADQFLRPGGQAVGFLAELAGMCLVAGDEQQRPRRLLVQHEIAPRALDGNRAARCAFGDRRITHAQSFIIGDERAAASSALARVMSAPHSRQ